MGYFSTPPWPNDWKSKHPDAFGNIKLDEAKFHKAPIPCFWCGSELNHWNIYYGNTLNEYREHLLGKYYPCDACEEAFAQGVTVIEISDEPTNEDQQSIVDGTRCYPTGRWTVLSFSDYSMYIDSDPDCPVIAEGMMDSVNREDFEAIRLVKCQA